MDPGKRYDRPVPSAHGRPRLLERPFFLDQDRVR